MAQNEHHMPDVDLPKHSLLPMGPNNTAHQHINHDIDSSNDKDERPRVFNQDQRKRRVKSKLVEKPDGFISIICKWTVEHQIGTANTIVRGYS